tara:strand:+ start:608 stop:757 length:150 start_codon:yes stop_codon:yes gene_type:complete
LNCKRLESGQKPPGTAGAKAIEGSRIQEKFREDSGKTKGKIKVEIKVIV